MIWNPDFDDPTDKWIPSPTVHPRCRIVTLEKLAARMSRLLHRRDLEGAKLLDSAVLKILAFCDLSPP